MYIIKRDGSILPFETEKIANAIRKAMSKVNYEDTTNKADTIAQKVGTLFINKGLDTVPLEDVQDQVEVALMTDGLYNVAKEYILYRQQRSDVRVIKGKLNDTIKSLVDVTVDNDDKRENANIDAKSTMGTLLKVGTTVLKEFNLQTYCKEKHTENHRKGVWHEHDLDLGYIDINCVFIPLSRLLKNGFSTGHGFLRSPTSIRSASALTCIAIQSSQNDFLNIA